MAISEISNNATPAVVGDNTATTGGPALHHPKQETAGVYGHSKRGHGVVGITDKSTIFSGVYGEGVNGVTGVSENGTGIEGYGTGPNGVGVFGQGGENTPAIVGNTTSATQPGVLGQNSGPGPGVVGTSNNEAGVRGKSLYGTGVVGIGGTFAAESVGKVRIQGDVAVSGDVILATGAFAQGEDNMMADNTVAEISLAQKLAEIDARTQRIEDALYSLARMTAHLPDGRALVNVVATIEAKVNQL